ncbi:MAG: hypothetical protein HN737_04610 [Desulfobacterales bacterium]|jgi:hypothetical protein|nr:hypothetical protein [Desulfobacteraceae bacterium]MBT7085366.1 hypothetical protein [Desulfobacterales bacterium]MBT7696674.1 hypothetical protein [Desulfobacterales bacterium]
MPITTEINNDKRLTTHTVIGDIPFEELMITLKQMWEVQITTNVLWDFRKGGLDLTTSENIGTIVDFVRGNAHKRTGGKSAFVSLKDLDFGMTRMLMTFAEMKEYPVETEVFRSFDNAIEWLNEE